MHHVHFITTVCTILTLAFTYISTPLGTRIGFAEIDAIRITGREANAAAPGGANDATLHALTACSLCV